MHADLIRQAKSELLKLFARFPVSADDRAVRLEAYWETLSGLPPACIIAACRRASQTGLGSPEYLPSAAQLYQEARRIREDSLPPPRLLPRDPPAPRAPDLGQRLADLARSLRAGSGLPACPAGREEGDMMAGLDGPVRLSEAALRSLQRRGG